MAEYIDREAFIEQKRELYCKDCDRRKGMKNGKYRILYDIGDVPCRACGIEDVLSDVEDFPAAEVQPVKHGRWLLNSDRIPVCSVCDGIALQKILLRFPTPEYYSKFVLSNYCPHCGAIIDGGDF